MTTYKYNWQTHRFESFDYARDRAWATYQGSSLFLTDLTDLAKRGDKYSEQRAINRAARQRVEVADG